jgi:5-methylcytosine-specific restriction protein B
MTNPTMKILYGAPGTGKTWRAAREAVKAVDPAGYAAAMLAADPDTVVRQLHSKLLTDGRILWVTFHSSYSYEDFMEGYRQIVDELGRVSYRVVDGPFKTICMRAKFADDLQIGERLTDGAGRAAGVVVDKDAGGWVVQTTPGRSDEVAATIDKYVPRYVIDRIIEKGFPSSIFSMSGTGLVELHKVGLDPSDEALPAPEEGESETTRKGSTLKKIIAARTGMFSSTDLSNASHYGSVVRRILELRSGGPAAGAPVAIVIDEINRAEPSRVFGELLTLLETDKRHGMPEEKKIWLPYSKTSFSVPANVSVIGTMNTVDRSLTALDFAMRRRFDFELVRAEATLVPKLYGEVNLQELLNRLNSRLTSLLGSRFEFGHSFMMQNKLDAIGLSKGWLGLADAQLRTLAHVFRTNIVPTLAEYFQEDWRKIRAVAGESRNGSERFLLFEQAEVDTAFMDRLPNEYEISKPQAGNYSQWWDPEGPHWAPDKFKLFAIGLAAGW